MTSPSHKKIPPIQNSELKENKRVEAPRQIFVFLLWRVIDQIIVNFKCVIIELLCHYVKLRKSV